MNYILIPITAVLLVTAQSFWNRASKTENIFAGSTTQIISNIFHNPNIWVGLFLYFVATGFYLLSLSKNNFFVVQSVMTGLALVFSTLIATTFFGEKITSINYIGIFIILIGAFLVIQK